MGGDQLPLWKYVVAGGSAGVMEISIMYPTDVIKTRTQLSTKSVSMYGTFQSILQSQGVGGFYRGIISPILAEAPKRAWKFTANEKFKQFFKSQSKNGELTVLTSAASGSLAGFTETVVNCPFETVKVQMQSEEFLTRFKGTTECLVYLVKNEGILSVYKGFEAQAWRNIFWNGAYFGIIGYLNIKNKDRVETQARSKAEKLFEKFYTGAFASSVGTLLNTPFDVAKSRMQLQSSTPGQPLKYRYAFQSVALIAKEEGFGSIYKGLGARLLRLGPGGGIMIVAFDFIVGLLDGL